MYYHLSVRSIAEFEKCLRIKRGSTGSYPQPLTRMTRTLLQRYRFDLPLSSLLFCYFVIFVIFVVLVVLAVLVIYILIGG